jgi:pimeloyl-ACP methyl ester carboxylesterase
VHGLWLRGHEALLLRRRLARDLDADTRAFSYPSVRATPAHNRAALALYLTQLDCEQLHLVGHSLGGVLITRLFDDPPQLPPGRIVLLGSPLGGSQAARTVANWPGGRTILGVTVCQELLKSHQPRWIAPREIGVIAGSTAVGLGRLAGVRAGPNDGTVTVAETALAGATDQIVLPVSHSGMVFSGVVARQTATFLREARFAR